MMSKCVVRWHDGSHDNNRTCLDCGLENCPNPVYKDYYKEIITKKSYWNWVEGNAATNGKGGMDEYIEPMLANPDTLQGKDDEWSF